MNFARRIYRWLAHAFPHEFKLAYGQEIMLLGDDVISDIAKKHRIVGLVPFIADIAVRVPLEYLNEMRGDTRYALRALLKSPGFALVGVISLGLGMGLTTTVYNSKWQVITRELPSARNADHLVIPEKNLSYYYIEQYREQKNLFAGVAAFQIGVPFNVNFQGDLNAKPQRVFGQLVSPDYFSVLGVPAQRGRVLSPELEKPGTAPVVVISDRFWRNRLNSSPEAVGQTLRLNGQPATIVGITPKDFNGAFSINPAEVFVPITAPADLAPELGNDVLHQRNARQFMAIICLAPGVTMESAEAALDATTRHLDEQDPTALKLVDKSKRITLFSGGTMAPLPRELKPVLAGLFGILMALIMAITCMNLANMLLARGANRRKELAIRLAIGASRFRLIRQMLTEGILLSFLGGIAGFFLAYIQTKMSARFVPPTAVPTESDFTPGWHAGIFVFCLAILCGIAFSLFPALRATKSDVTPALKEGSALQLPGHRRFGLRNLLMVAQITGSLILLLITGFLVLGLSQTSDVEARFDTRTMYLLSIDPVRDGYTTEKARALFDRLPAQLKASGSVGSVAMAAQEPFAIEDEDSATPFMVEDSQGTPRMRISAISQTVGAGYFAALSETMVAGREFVASDERTQPDNSKAVPVILNENAAQGFFGTGNAIGRHVSDDKQSYEVVGVVNNLKNSFAPKLPVVYLPLTQRNFVRPPATGITLMVRSDAGPDAIAAIRRQMTALDPNLNLFNVRTLSEFLEQSRASQRFAVDTYGGIGAFGLVLAAIGLAGVTAYSVAQRRREIGIRMALGARKAQVLRLVLREGAALVTVGTALGFLGAFGLAKMLSALTKVFLEVLKVGTSDPRLLVGAPVLLAALALLACYIPARRAVRIDPMKALREG